MSPITRHSTLVNRHWPAGVWVLALVISVSTVVSGCSNSSSSPTSHRDPTGALVPDVPIRIGHPASPSFKGIAVEIANQRLRQRGWDVDSVFFTQTDLAAAALAQGTTQFTLMQPLDPLRVIDRGVNVRWVLENNPGDFVLVAPTGAQTCADLEGLRVALSSKTSTNSMATATFLIQDCALNSEIIYVLEGEARVAALLADQVDLTFMQLADFVVLEREAPGRFAIFPTGDTYGTGGSGLWVSGSWADQNREIAKTYVIELLKAYRMADQDPQGFEKAVREHLPELDPETASRTIAVHRDLGGFPVNGGDVSIVENAITFFAPLGEISDGLNAQEIFDTALLEEALSTIGRIEGKR